MQREGDDVGSIDDLLSSGDSDDQCDHTRVRYREFTALRWLASGLMLGGASILISSAWWIGILVGGFGFALLEIDNAQRRRALSGQGHEN